MSDEDAIAEVCDDLRRAVERLDELAYDALRQAVAAGETSRPQRERRIVRARNALERAIAILEHAGQPGDPPPDAEDGGGD